MKTLDLNEKSIKKTALAAAEFISKGKVVVIPTDTVYGISALATDKKAVGKVYALKRRSQDKPFLVLVKSFCMLRRVCFLNKRQYDFIKNNSSSQKPLTVILKIKDERLKFLVSKSDKLAVRIPVENKFLKKLISAVGDPIISTSLNISNQPIVDDLENLEKVFGKNKIDLVVRVSKMKKKKPSKIADISDINEIKIIRD